MNVRLTVKPRVLNVDVVKGALGVGSSDINDGVGLESQRHGVGVRAGLVLHAAHALLLADANVIAEEERERGYYFLALFSSYTFNFNSLLLGEMVVVGGEEVEGGEASGKSGVVLQAAVRSAGGKKNIIDPYFCFY